MKFDFIVATFARTWTAAHPRLGHDRVHLSRPESLDGFRYSYNRQGLDVLRYVAKLTLTLVFAVLAAQLSAEDKVKSSTKVVADPPSVGGEASSTVQVANLIYAGTKTSQCFSDHFLRRAEKDSAISTSRQLHSVKLSSPEVFNFPLIIMTGEGEFTFLQEERDNLRQFIERGGFLLASAGCSSKEWDRSFRKEMSLVFKEREMKTIGQDHLVFHTAYEVTKLQAKHGEPKPLVGIHFGNRLGVLYSQDGLNDTSNTKGCCCCGGNEITNAEEINVNILVYSLLQ